MPLIRQKYRAYPQLIRAMENRHRIYNQTLAYIAKKESTGDLLVIRPESHLPVHRVEKDAGKLRAAYEIGRTTATEKLDEIKRYLSV